MIVVVEPVPDTTAFRVSAEAAVLGFIREAVDRGGWVARSMGKPDGSTAATIRRFTCRHQAITWLAEREPAPAEPGRSPYAAPGQKRSA